MKFLSAAFLILLTANTYAFTTAHPMFRFWGVCDGIELDIRYSDEVPNVPHYDGSVLLGPNSNGEIEQLATRVGNSGRWHADDDFQKAGMHIIMDCSQDDWDVCYPHTTRQFFWIKHPAACADDDTHGNRDDDLGHWYERSAYITLQRAILIITKKIQRNPEMDINSGAAIAAVQNAMIQLGVTLQGDGLYYAALHTLEAAHDFKVIYDIDPGTAFVIPRVVHEE